MLRQPHVLQKVFAYLRMIAVILQLVNYISLIFVLPILNLLLANKNKLIFFKFTN